MNVPTVGPFESIESAHEFMILLEQSIAEALSDVRLDLEQAAADNMDRRVAALTLAVYKMNQLSTHVHKSRRILNDLRTIRRLLLAR